MDWSQVTLGARKVVSLLFLPFKYVCIFSADAYLFGASIHDLSRDLPDMLLHDFALVFVLEAECFVFDHFFLLLFHSLVRRSLLLILLRWHTVVILFIKLIYCHSHTLDYSAAH